MTVAEFLRQFESVPKDWEVTFGELEFVRVKTRGPSRVDIELDPLPYWSSDEERWRIAGSGDPPGDQVAAG